MRIDKFEDIKAWSLARELTKMVYQNTSTNKNFNMDLRLKSQVQSSAVSIMSNIAEGFSRNSNKEFVRFLFIAKGSLAELQSQLYVALDQKYIDPDQFNELYARADHIARLLSRFITYLKLNFHTQETQ